MHFKEIWIFGIGLLGGSIAQCLRKKNSDIKVYGVSRKEKNIENLVDYNVFDDYYTYDTVKSVSGLVVICTPVDTIKEIFKQIVSLQNGELVVTDTGSTKEKIIKEIKEIDKEKIFIGSHPMAGSEKSGFKNSDPDLFEGKKVIITPDKDTPDEIKNHVTQFWQELGAVVTEVSPELHDEITGLTSHTVHIVSSLLSHFLMEKEKYDGKYLSIYGNGLLDTTRVSMGDEEMWTSICKHNQDNLLKNLKQLKNKLNLMIESVNDLNLNDLKQFFREARLFREKFY